MKDKRKRVKELVKLKKKKKKAEKKARGERRVNIDQIPKSTCIGYLFPTLDDLLLVQH